MTKRIESKAIHSDMDWLNFVDSLRPGADEWPLVVTIAVSVTTTNIELIEPKGQWPDGRWDWLARVPAGVQDGDLAVIRQVDDGS